MNIRDRQILSLALPSIVSNITVPLLGMVDVAIVGHLGDAAYIGAISVGSMIFNIIYWLFGFLRMGTSGMTSQALGRRDLCEVTRLLIRSATVGLSVALMILMMQHPIRWLAFWLIAPEAEVQTLATTYYHICVWGAPAMLVLYGLTGWYIGMQNTRFPMVISIVQNVVNILASFLLVFVFHLEMRGVAIGTIIAQYTGLILSLSLHFTNYGKLRKHVVRQGLFAWDKMLRFFKVNSDIFLRTVCLVAVNLFFLSAGARQGAVLLAVNTLLMQLYILFSYVMDGFAFAGEALCGKYYGASNMTLHYQAIVLLGCHGFFVFYILVCSWWSTFFKTSDRRCRGGTCLGCLFCMGRGYPLCRYGRFRLGRGLYWCHCHPMDDMVVVALLRGVFRGVARLLLPLGQPCIMVGFYPLSDGKRCTSDLLLL